MPVRNLPPGSIAARADKAAADSLPVDRKALRINGKVPESERLRHIGIAAVGRIGVPLF